MKFVAGLNKRDRNVSLESLWSDEDLLRCCHGGFWKFLQVFAAFWSSERARGRLECCHRRAFETRTSRAFQVIAGNTEGVGSFIFGSQYCEASPHPKSTTMYNRNGGRAWEDPGDVPSGFIKGDCVVRARPKYYRQCSKDSKQLVWDAPASDQVRKELSQVCTNYCPSNWPFFRRWPT